MSSALQAFANGLPIALYHAVLSLALLVMGCVLHALISPYKEVQQIREGNAAAAISLGGVIFGLAVPLAMSLHASTTAAELAVWGAAVVIVQLLVFRLIDLLLAGLPQRVGEGEIAAAALLVAAKLAAAMILAAAVAG